MLLPGPIVAHGPEVVKGSVSGDKKGLQSEIIGARMFPKWEQAKTCFPSIGSIDMNVLGLPILHRFCENHVDCASQIHAWVAEVKEATWMNPNDIKARYVHGSFLPGDRVVFNIKGNKYRLDAKVYYQRQIVIVKRMGTHAEYDGWRF